MINKNIVLYSQKISLLSSCRADYYAALHRRVFGAAGWSAESFQRLIVSPFVRGWEIRHDTEETVGLLVIQWVEKECEILTFAVHPANQRLGLGTQLMDNVFSFFQKNGGQKIFLEVAEDNFFAQKFYKKWHFEQIGKREKYYSRKGQKPVSALTFCYKSKL